MLKITLHEKLSAEYGINGLIACPVLRVGQMFLPIIPSWTDSAIRLGEQFINMPLLLPTVMGTACSVTATELDYPTSLYAAAKAVCIR